MNRDKELYQQLRAVPWDRLWRDEVARFNASDPRTRFEKVAVVRAVGVVFSETGNAEDLESVKAWLRMLLKDPQEKIRRYAVAAIPKVLADGEDERVLLELLQRSESDREKERVAEALGKVGGESTLAQTSLPSNAEQRLKARVSESFLNINAALTEIEDIRINFWGRAGLEQIVREEILERAADRFKIHEVSSGLVAAKAVRPFSLTGLWNLRCYGLVGFQLAGAKDAAELISSKASLRILQTFTEGPIRYRLEFAGKGHQRGAVRDLADRVYQLAPNLLNSGANATWTIVVGPGDIELRPRMNPDPRFAYRRRDVPAASHPPLAACMARLAGKLKEAVVWDPFCGSGLELIERGLLGGVKKLIGTDRNAEAIQITRDNISAAIPNIETQLVSSDFRAFDPGMVDAIITNPPLGKRVPIWNLRGLIDDLFVAAGRSLRRGGCLVFANPLRIGPRDPSLKLKYGQAVDFGGFSCRLEKYVKA